MGYYCDLLEYEDIEKRRSYFKGLESLEGISFDVPKLKMRMISNVTMDQLKDENIFFFVKEDEEHLRLAARAEIDKYILKRDYALYLDENAILADYHKTFVKYLDCFWAVDDGAKKQILDEINEEMRRACEEDMEEVHNEELKEVHNEELKEVYNEELKEVYNEELKEVYNEVLQEEVKEKVK